MENKNMRKLNVTVQCMAVYNSSIMVPRELTFEDRKSTRLNSSHTAETRMPSSA